MDKICVVGDRDSIYGFAALGLDTFYSKGDREEDAKLLKRLADETEGDFSFEYSPESFPGTEVEYAIEVCNAVLDVWKPKKSNKVIINIPTTVENAMPHVFATQIECISNSLKYRDAVTLSLHPHNDRGCGISDAELGLLFNIHS